MLNDSIAALLQRVAALEGTITFSQINETVQAYLTASESYVEGETSTVIGDYVTTATYSNNWDDPAGYGTSYTGTMSVVGEKTYSYTISGISIYNVVPNAVSSVTMDEINAFRTAMVDGTPEILADPYKEVVNLLPISIDTDGSIYNASDTPGYKTGYRLNSSSVEVASTNDTVSGYIAVELSKTHLFENLYYLSTDSSHYIAVFDSSFTKLNNGRIDGIVAGSSWCEPVYNTDATKIVGITPLSTFASASKIAYFRVSQGTSKFPGATTKIYVK